MKAFVSVQAPKGKAVVVAAVVVVLSVREVSSALQEKQNNEMVSRI